MFNINIGASSPTSILSSKNQSARQAKSTKESAAEKVRAQEKTAMSTLNKQILDKIHQCRLLVKFDQERVMSPNAYGNLSPKRLQN